MTVALAARGVRVVLLDIEGTTTPLSFVHDVLFPFARTHIGGWIETNEGLPDYARLAGMLESEHQDDRERGEPVPAWSAVTDAACAASMRAYLEWLMDRDRKSPALKLVQGWIWELGYQAGELHGEIFPDVPAALRRWRDQGIHTAIYSSGSELAQRRLFASAGEGDLTPLLVGFFDTAVGPKLVSSSYRCIADALGHPVTAVLFISDVVGELQAAQEAGLPVLLSIRPGNLAQPGAERFEHVTTFEGL